MSVDIGAGDVHQVPAALDEYDLADVTGLDHQRVAIHSTVAQDRFNLPTANGRTSRG